MAGTAPPDAMLFEHAACGLLAAGIDGVIVRANATVCRWLGYDAAALVGQVKLQDLFSIGGRVFYQTHCLPLLQMQGSVAEVQVDLLHRDRSRVPVLMNIVRRRHAEATVDEIAVFVATDRRSYERELLAARQTAEASLEARRGAEAQLQAINLQLSNADRRKDEFLATLAHELRNPLAPMRNVLEILKLQTAGAPPYDSSLAILERQLRHITHLVDDLMEVSRISQGQMTLRRAPVDLAAVMQAAVDDCRGLIDGAGHTLSVQLPAQPVSIDGDNTRLMQVVMNLLTNAVKYTPAGGAIWLRGWREGDQALLSVRDTGIGIPVESLASVFEMFSQLAPALERSKGGLGIGLALVRGLVGLHGGSISATSGGVGQGSEFLVRLPALAGAAAPERPAAAPAAAAPRRVLVVDDNVDAAETMTMALDMLGYEARAAHDGASGLREAEQFAPHVVLLDIGLPDLNGYEVAGRIRRAAWGAGMVLVAATGWGQDADRQRARDAGFDRHMTKPIDFTLLQALLAETSRL
ncbi:MAG: ATP-binding protein [Pseudomonadota bacterium]|nr:ATP-binding protein [Pseudomonadota bacterium]